MRTNARKVIADIEKKLKGVLDDAPLVLANTGARHFAKSWDRQGYGDDQTVQKWKPRKKETKRSEGKKILVGTGQLRRAVMNSIRQANGNRIVWSVRLPYAQVHNEGYAGRQTVRRGQSSFTRNMRIPARPFMKGGYILNRVLKKKLEQMFKTVIR